MEKRKVGALSLIILILSLSGYYIYSINVNSNSDNNDDNSDDPYSDITYSDTNYNVFKVADYASNSYARQKNQISSGIYDNTADKTYIVYSAGINQEASAGSPYIKYYDHELKQFSDEVEIYQTIVEPDAHYYPQILIDDNGYIHVFHTFHGNAKILHAVSKDPYEIDEWDLFHMDNSENSTYGAAFKANNGDLYLFFRGLVQYNPMYEPEYYFKSTDDGTTWSLNKVIDPAPYTDNWATIYTKAFKFDATRNGLHITYGVHKDHNDKFDKHYYIFFSFNDNHVYAPNGDDLGEFVNQTDATAKCLLFTYNEDIDFDVGGNTRMAITIDGNGRPIVLYNYYESVGEDDQLHIAEWNGTSWNISIIGEMDDTTPFDTEITHTYPNGTIEYSVFGKKWAKEVRRWDFRGGSYLRYETIVKIYGDNDHGFNHINLITNYNTELKAVFLHGSSENWRNPVPTGRILAMNDTIH